MYLLARAKVVRTFVGCSDSLYICEDQTYSVQEIVLISCYRIALVKFKCFC